MSKPTVVITVSGGVAEYQVLPIGAKVDIVFIDYDNLKDCESCPADVQAKIDEVKALPETDEQSKEYKAFVLEELEGVLESVEDAEEEFEALEDLEGGKEDA